MVFRFPPLCALCASVRDSSYFRKFSQKSQDKNNLSPSSPSPPRSPGHSPNLFAPFASFARERPRFGLPLTKPQRPLRLPPSVFSCLRVRIGPRSGSRQARQGPEGRAGSPSPPDCSGRKTPRPTRRQGQRAHCHSAEPRQPWVKCLSWLYAAPREMTLCAFCYRAAQTQPCGHSPAPGFLLEPHAPLGEGPGLTPLRPRPIMGTGRWEFPPHKPNLKLVE